MIAYILDTWSYHGDGINGGYAPKIAGLALVKSVSVEPTAPDVFSIPTDPPVVVVEVVADSIDSIQSHSDYGPGAILYDLPNPYPPNGMPSAAEYGQRRAYAARLGISNTQFRAMFGTQANPKSRKQGTDNLIEWVRTLPKGRK